MYVIEKMRLNRFELRPCVSARSICANKGESKAVPSKLSADCFDSPSVDGASKLKILGLVDEMAKTAYAKRESNGQAASMPGDNAVNM